MNKKESFVHLKAVMECDWRVDKCEPDMERQVFKITPYHGLNLKPFEISVSGDNELAALRDLVRGLEREGIYD